MCIEIFRITGKCKQARKFAKWGVCAWEFIKDEKL
jgi:hypothetical protein